jgi:serine/threonine protein kinase
MLFSPWAGIVHRDIKPANIFITGRGFAAASLRAMELLTILNRCHRFRGFVYQYAHFSADKKSIEVAVRPRNGSVAVCSRCHVPVHRGPPLQKTQRWGTLSYDCSHSGGTVPLEHQENSSGISLLIEAVVSSAGSAMFLNSGYFWISVGGACTLLPVIMAFNSSAFTPALLSK